MQNYKNILVKTNDGSNTLFSQKYNQHFHNIKDGSLSEALNKHIIPAILLQNKIELNILDICYGLGYNTLATIYYIKKHSLDIKLNIFSVELDFELIKSLKEFIYPNEFNDFKNIIDELSTKQKFTSENLNIELKIENARAYIKKFPSNFFDIVYQDAFSSSVNIELWTKEYFEDIYKISKQDVVLTTYAVSTNIRLSLYEAGFYIYENIANGKKTTIATKQKRDFFAKYIDMELKKTRNKEAKALSDNF